MSEPYQVIRTAEGRLIMRFEDNAPIVEMQARNPEARNDPYEDEWVPIQTLAEGEQELDLLLALLVAICDRPGGRPPFPRRFSRD